jgi:hypothetical protein
MDVVAPGAAQLPCHPEVAFFSILDFFVSSIIPAIALLFCFLSCAFLMFSFLGVRPDHCMFTFGVTGKREYRLSACWKEGVFSVSNIQKRELLLFVWK